MKLNEERANTNTHTSHATQQPGVLVHFLSFFLFAYLFFY